MRRDALAKRREPAGQRQRSTPRDLNENDRFVLPDDVAEYIARAIKSNVRELEGALTRLMAYASLTGAAVSLVRLAGHHRPFRRQSTGLQTVKLFPDRITDGRRRQ